MNCDVMHVLAGLNAYAVGCPEGARRVKFYGELDDHFPGGYDRHLDFESNDRISSYSQATTNITCPSSSHY